MSYVFIPILPPQPLPPEPTRCILSQLPYRTQPPLSEKSYCVHFQPWFLTELHGTVKEFPDPWVSKVLRPQSAKLQPCMPSPPARLLPPPGAEAQEQNSPEYKSEKVPQIRRKLERVKEMGEVIASGHPRSQTIRANGTQIQNCSKTSPVQGILKTEWQKRSCVLAGDHSRAPSDSHSD